LKDPISNAALIEKYDAVPYEGQSNALSHPEACPAAIRKTGAKATFPGSVERSLTLDAPIAR
jgi:hypothetical protein